MLLLPLCLGLWTTLASAHYRVLFRRLSFWDADHSTLYTPSFPPPDSPGVDYEDVTAACANGPRPLPAFPPSSRHLYVVYVIAANATDLGFNCSLTAALTEASGQLMSVFVQEPDDCRVVGRYLTAAGVVDDSATVAMPNATSRMEAEYASPQAVAMCQRRWAPGFQIQADRGVRVTVNVQRVYRPFVARLLLSNVQRRDSRLHLHYVHPLLGYVETKAWVWQFAASYQPLLDTYETVTVPGGHVVLISVAINLARVNRLRACNESVEIYREEDTRPLWRFCALDKFSPGPVVLRTAKLFIRFRSGTGLYLAVDEFGRRMPHRNAAPGFRLLFTFHKFSLQPHQLDDGRWNCSVPHWEDFADHLRCNLATQCVNGEDEADCLYKPCRGTFGVRLHGKCYSPHPYFSHLPLSTMHDNCSNVGGKLFSLDNEDFNPVVRALRLDWLTRGANVIVSGFRYVFPLTRLCVQMRTVGSAFPYICMWALTKQPGFLVYDSGFKGKESHYLSQVLQREIQRLCSDNACFFVCVSGTPTTAPAKPEAFNSIRREVRQAAFPFRFVVCAKGHVANTFMANDPASDCQVPVNNGLINSSRCVATGSDGGVSCTDQLIPAPPVYRCRGEGQSVPYSLVCDGHMDCADGSDEGCASPPCDFNCFVVDSELFMKHYGTCNHMSRAKHCFEPRYKRCVGPTMAKVMSLPVVNHARVREVPAHDQSEATVAPLPCPEGTFHCPGTRLCIEIHFRCNEINDCPDGEDEAGCDDYTCPGYYRCRGSKVCLHPRELCKKKNDELCPQKDDHWAYCADRPAWDHLDCPPGCTCPIDNRSVLLCTAPFPMAREYQELRYLEADGTGMTLRHVHLNIMLIYLSLAGCNVTRIDRVPLLNLRILNLARNRISHVSDADLQPLADLDQLTLSHNPIVSLLAAESARGHPFSLTSLDLSGVRLGRLNTTSLSAYTELRVLNLTDCRIDSIERAGSDVLANLRVLDLRGNPITSFPVGLYEGMEHLSHVRADNFKLCCPSLLPPEFDVDKCQAPMDEISSCESLLRSDFYRACLALLTILALTGNLASFAVRLHLNRRSKPSVFSLFVSHLCLSDFLMGAYLFHIGLADHRYRGNYLLYDSRWRDSVACRVAGVLSLASCEVSSLLICLITLDRLLVLRFPFSRVRFSRSSGRAACALAWGLGLALAVVPLLPAFSHWEFYSQTGICIPLPITRASFKGRHFAFAVMVVFNFVLFLLIAAGQLFVYNSILANSLTGHTTKASNDAVVARRLLTVVVSDFLCWFPVGILGILASRGVPVSIEVNTLVAVLVLPLNAALNPFLYTLNLLQERWRRSREDRLLGALVSRQGH